ncbi:Panacea domain-containing protein [Alloscardovia omnicolens]|uniref:Panacea domain-containing protein n=1 Tax=Alloscardovia omnicolens TaxID=419015 RepID=UPI001FCA6B9B|nr:type II toxin-antitoxin system antitoxin SocA domain-containing protein [Alloscardovia omnicolens]
MSITALDVANTFIARHPSLFLSNLSLNKLVYFAQVESLRQTGKPLYDSEIQAQQYGPVVPEVYYAFHEWRNLIITSPAMQVKNDSYMNQIVDAVADKYGFFNSF